MDWTIEIEKRPTGISYVVWHEKGFHAFTNLEDAEDFINNGCKL